jgi:hypothetical protein
MPPALIEWLARVVKEQKMRRCRAGLVVACGALCCGCLQPHGLPSGSAGSEQEARQVVSAGLDAIGGLAAWRRADTVRATAVVTLYDKTQAAYVSRQRHRIDLDGRRIRAWGETARGRWRAEAGADGHGTFHAGDSEMDPAVQQGIVDALALLAHRVRGPLNLLDGPNRPAVVAPVRIAGQSLRRVAVAPDGGEVAAYYFGADPNDRALRLVTAGADRPGRDGTVTLYTYRDVGGLSFSSRIQVVRLGRHVLIGTERVLDVAYTDVRVD